jgi:hypothetical protein
MQVKTKQQQNWRSAYEVLFTHLGQFLLCLCVLYSYDGIRLQVPSGGSMHASVKNNLEDVGRNSLVKKVPTT